MRASQHKIGVFLGTLCILIVILGTLMFLVEGNQSGFTSIPQSMYWAIVTLTTVGFSDISPVTPLGRVVGAVLMVVGMFIT